MRIGILPELNPSSGGVYQYSLSVLNAISAWKVEGCGDEYLLFQDEESLAANRGVELPGWQVASLTPQRSASSANGRLAGFRRIVGEGPHREAWRSLRRRLLPERPPTELDRIRPDLGARNAMLARGVGMMLYPAPRGTSFECGVPYVFAVHDLQHRLQPRFPEVSAGGEWERREYLFRNGVRNALAVLADSEVGKEDLLNCYGDFGLTEERVEVLPFLPASYLPLHVAEDEIERVRDRYSLPPRFIFYPAQFWPHKNHLRIVQALALLRKAHGLRVPLVLSGSAGGSIRYRTLRDLRREARRLGVSDQLALLGVVPNDDMAPLYASATALVMPTFFGPTNIPVLEAWSLGCPVLTSDIRGIREQAGDAAFLVDPSSVEEIAAGIHAIWLNENLRTRLAQRGKERLSEYTPADFSLRLRGILERAKSRLLVRS